MTEADILKYGRMSQPKPPTKKVFVFGPEMATNYKLVKAKLDKVTFFFDSVSLIVRSCEYVKIGDGKFAGMGVLAQRWADERYNRYFTNIFHPYPEVYGEAKAVEKRDEFLMEELTRLYKGVAVAFDDGQDPVVRYLRDLCEFYEVKVKTIRYEDD